MDKRVKKTKIITKDGEWIKVGKLGKILVKPSERYRVIQLRGNRVESIEKGNIAPKGEALKFKNKVTKILVELGLYNDIK